MTLKYGERLALVELYLSEFGPGTSGEIARHLGMSRHNVTNALRRLSAPPKRRVHVCDWTDNVEGQRAYIYPVYAIGNLPDKSRPPGIVRRKQAKQRYEAAVRSRARTNFVFNLGGANAKHLAQH